MFRIFSKNFCKNLKLEEAKKRAMNKYEHMISEKKTKANRVLEATFKEETRREREKDGEIQTPKIEDYKSNQMNKKIENVVENFEYIPKPKVELNKLSEDIRRNNISHQIVVENNTLLYKLHEYFKQNKDEENFVKIYEMKYDPGYQKFLKMLVNILKAIVIIQTYNFAKKIYLYLYPTKEGTQPSSIPIKGMLFFYSSMFVIYTLSKGIGKRTLTRLTVSNEKVRMYFYNKNKNIQHRKYLELEIKNLVKINSQKKNSHVIFFVHQGKMNQVFLPKNAIYDKILVSSLCHPKVYSVKLI